MKIALVTTTINVPHVLRLYRRADPDVRFFIAVDDKSPIHEINELCLALDNATWTTTGHNINYKCSELIGWNCIQRRNIATLEALKWGADIIVFVDDDNIPLNTAYFADYEMAMDPETPFSGLLAAPDIEWFDVGGLLDPPSSHRGFPHELAHRKPRLSHIVDARIGAVAGIVLGDPDISAVTRIARSPHVLNHSPILANGIGVNPRHTRTVWNTQNSAVLRELAPAMLLCPQFRRYDDIIASMVCQRVMVDTGHHMLFGPPFVYQERNTHNLTRDLADEAWGQEHLLDVQALLWRTNTDDITTVPNRVLRLYAALDTMMPGVATLAEAWVEDCMRAMG